MEAESVILVEITAGRLTCIRVDGKRQIVANVPDRLPTNICFSGKDPSSAFITLSSTGRLTSMSWPHHGLLLNYLNKWN